MLGCAISSTFASLSLLNLIYTFLLEFEVESSMQGQWKSNTAFEKLKYCTIDKQKKKQQQQKLFQNQVCSDLMFAGTVREHFFFNDFVKGKRENHFIYCLFSCLKPQILK